jgi:hypothetical protein
LVYLIKYKMIPLFLKITILVFDKFIYKSYSFEYRFTTSIIVCNSCILSLNNTMSSAYIRRYKFNILSSWDLQFCLINSTCFLNGNYIELCNEVMYLGILFYFNGNFLQTQKRLSDQGRKAVFSLFNKIQDDCYNHETFLSLFDTYITCIWYSPGWLVGVLMSVGVMTVGVMRRPHYFIPYFFLLSIYV